MISPKRTALYLAISAMAFAAGEASAGCKYIPNPPGSLVCASWIKGSEVCEITSTGISGAAPLLSATCSITGANFIDGAEGSFDTTGAYCASGALPPGLCTSAVPLLTPFSVSSSSAVKPADAKPPKPPKPKACPPPPKPPKPGPKPPNPPKPGQTCGDITVPGGDVYLTEEASTPVCGTPHETFPGSGDFVTDCTSSAEILPPDGSTCSDGQPAVDFTASAMLAVMVACVSDGGSGEICDTTYDFCTVDPNAPDGTPYDCTDITDQGTRGCGFSGNPLTFAPDDPQCGQVRSTCF